MENLLSDFFRVDEFYVRRLLYPDASGYMQKTKSTFQEA